MLFRCEGFRAVEGEEYVYEMDHDSDRYPPLTGSPTKDVNDL